MAKSTGETSKDVESISYNAGTVAPSHGRSLDCRGTGNGFPVKDFICRICIRNCLHLLNYQIIELTVVV